MIDWIKPTFLSMLAAGGILAAGCGGQVELTFAPSKDLGKLPEKQQTQLGETLTTYFGSPRFPKFMEVAPDEKQPAEVKEVLLVEKLDRQHLQHGREVFTRQCAGCHGATGDGNGPAGKYLDPPPRDYRLGRFKFTSTPRGSKPRREDLARIIRHGAKGTSMPTFRFIAEEDLQAVIDYVILLSTRGEMEHRLITVAEQDLAEDDNLEPALAAEQSKVIGQSWAQAESQIVRPLTPQPQNTQESVDAGARAFVQLNCFKCHGRDGRGNKTLDVGKDDWGRTAYAADLTTGMLHGGRRPIDIYRRIYSGINATPMPAFAQPDSGKGETETQRSETIWHMVHFITSVVDGKPLPEQIIDEEIKRLPSSQPMPSAADAAQ